MLEIPQELFHQVVGGTEARGREAVGATKPAKRKPRRRRPKAPVAPSEDGTRPPGGQPTEGEEGMASPDASEGTRRGKEEPRPGPSGG
jgi:hypothetical protein